MRRLPLVVIPGCVQSDNTLEKQRSSVGHKYARALSDVAGVLPVMAPAFTVDSYASDLAAQGDGLLLSGALSNVAPGRYGAPEDPRFAPFDPARDALSLGLIEAFLAQGKPILGICRGMQELNVALGGTLRSELQDLSGLRDHRGPMTGSVSVDYAPTHGITVAPDGILADFVRDNGLETLRVNSLHRQGIATLAPSLRVEATADDGVVEAVRRPGANFCFAVQWHPEYRAAEDPLSRFIFHAFGQACRDVLKKENKA